MKTTMRTRINAAHEAASLLVRTAILSLVLFSMSAGSAGAAAIQGGGMRGGKVAIGVVDPFTFNEGLQTNAIEIGRHVAFAATEPYATDRTNLASDATSARDSWAYTLTAGDWESDAGNCEPVGATESGTEFDLRTASTDILAMAIAGYTTGSASYYEAARTRILQFAALTDFDFAAETLFDGANQCALDLGTAVANVLEAAWFLEDASYSGWSIDDKMTVADWLIGEAIPAMSWAPQRRKNNWGVVVLRSMVYAAHFIDGYAVSFTTYDHLKNPTVLTPATYIANVKSTILPTWLSASGGAELDSECAAAPAVFGVQSTGGFPDELRRTTGTVNCGQTSMAFACPGDVCPQNSGAQFYQLKALNALAGTCEALRRIDGNGTACFNLATHGGTGTIIEDGLLFATGGDYQTLGIQATTQGVKYLAGEFYEDGCILDALDSGTPDVRGGRDVAYAKVTHAPGVSNLATETPCGGVPFVTIAQADAANGTTDYSDLTIPDLYPTLPFDWTGWTQYDVTTVGGTDPAGAANFTSCADLDNTGATDVSAALQCMLNGMAAQTCLFFPAGTYQIEIVNTQFYRPDFAHSERCLTGATGTRSAVININDPDMGTAIATLTMPNNNNAVFLDWENVVNPNFVADGAQTGFDAATLTWTDAVGLRTHGQTVIHLNDTSDFTTTYGASGHWILLATDPASSEPGSCCEWMTRVTAINSATELEIAHPLPKDFLGTNPRAYVVDPAYRWVLANLTLAWDDQIKDHQNGANAFLGIRNSAETILYNVQMNGNYRQNFNATGEETENLNELETCPPTCDGIPGNDVFRHSANGDLYIWHSAFRDGRWDKGSNGYGMVLANVDRLMIHDSDMQHVTGFAFGKDSDSILVSFNDIHAPPPETLIDTTPHDGCEDGSGGLVAVADQLCDESYLGDGSAGNDCRVCQTAHSAIHASTVTTIPVGAAWTHCNTNDAVSDANGGTGDTSCHGKPVGKVYSALEWHNEAGSNALILRNEIDGGIWFANGSGFNNVILLANHWRPQSLNGAPAFNTAGADPGMLKFREEGPSGTQTSWTTNTVFAGNVIEGSGTGGEYPGVLGEGSGGFDAYGVGVIAMDNVVEVSCRNEGTVNVGPCTAIDNSNLLNATGTVMLRNTVGEGDTYLEGGTIPSAPVPGWNSWADIPFLVKPPSDIPPYGVGVDAGDPDTAPSCLPATYRRLGSCP